MDTADRPVVARAELARDAIPQDDYDALLRAVLNACPVCPPACSCRGTR